MISSKRIVLAKNKNKGGKKNKLSFCKTERIEILIKAYFEVIVHILLELLDLQEDSLIKDIKTQRKFTSYIFIYEKNKYILHLGMSINAMVGLWAVPTEFWAEHL